MDQEQFKKRTKELALAVVRLVESLPRKRSADVMGRQLLRAATSVGANYRAACRGQFPADMIAKLHIVLEEADETAYWLGLLSESGLLSGSDAGGVLSEAHGIAAMTVASPKTIKSRYLRHRPSVETIFSHRFRTLSDADLHLAICNLQS